MSKYEANLNCDFDTALSAIHEGIMRGSASASYEDGSDYFLNGVRCAVRVYERYSWIGSNRVSLNITLMSSGSGCWLCAITSGGSQAVFYKINTFGEQAFLDCVREIVMPLI